MRLVWLIREEGIWKNFLRDWRRIVSNYERAKFTREARVTIRRFACLLIFAQRVDFSPCYLSPKLKITDNLGTGFQKGMALFAGCQSYFPRKLRKRKFVPGEKDSLDPHGRRQSRGKKGSNHFFRSVSSLERATLFPEGQQPRYQERKINRT